MKTPLPVPTFQTLPPKTRGRSAVAATLLVASVAWFPRAWAAEVPVPTAPDDAIWAGPNVVVPVPSAALDAIVGRYDYIGAILTVTREGDQVFAQLSGQPKFEIFPKSETLFFWKVVDAQVAFVKNERGEVVKAMHHQGGNTIIAQKLADIPVAKIDSAVFDAYVGSYESTDGQATMNVSREGDRFFIQLTNQPQVEVFPKSETEFFLKVVNAQLTFVKDAGGKVTKVVDRQNGQAFEFTRSESSVAPPEGGVGTP